MVEEWIKKIVVGNGSWIALPENSSSHSIPDPDPKDKNIWLFDLSKDPLEENDLFDSFPDIATSMLNRLEEYQSTAVKPRYPKGDPQCNPDLHGGAWGPWRPNERLDAWYENVVPEI